jgi:molybdate transport system ATP-binding protein
VALYRHRPEGTPRNVWRCTVEGSEDLGTTRRVELAGPVRLVAEVTAEAVDDLGVRDGDQLWASVKATEIGVFPA